MHISHTHISTHTLSWCSSRNSLTVASASCTAFSGGYPAQTHRQHQNLTHNLQKVMQWQICSHSYAPVFLATTDFPLKYSNTVFSHFLSCWVAEPRWDTKITHILATNWQIEKNWVFLHSAAESQILLSWWHCSTAEVIIHQVSKLSWLNKHRRATVKYLWRVHQEEFNRRTNRPNRRLQVCPEVFMVNLKNPIKTWGIWNSQWEHKWARDNLFC